MPANVYRHTAAGFDGWRVQFRGTPKYFSVIPHRAKGRRYPETVALAYETAVTWANANRQALGGRINGRVIHRGAVRAQSKVRGVGFCRNTVYASWYDPPLHPNKVYFGTTTADFDKAARLRRRAEKLILAGQSTAHLLKR